MFKVTVTGPTGDQLERAMMETVVNNLKAKAQGCRCPTHGQQGQLTVRGPASRMSVDVQGCCQQLIDMITAKIAR